jgi:hypothetical protein
MFAGPTTQFYVALLCPAHLSNITCRDRVQGRAVSASQLWGLVDWKAAPLNSRAGRVKHSKHQGDLAQRCLYTSLLYIISYAHHFSQGNDYQTQITNKTGALAFTAQDGLPCGSPYSMHIDALTYHTLVSSQVNPRYPVNFTTLLIRMRERTGSSDLNAARPRCRRASFVHRPPG